VQSKKIHCLHRAFAFRKSASYSLLPQPQRKHAWTWCPPLPAPRSKRNPILNCRIRSKSFENSSTARFVHCANYAVPSTPVDRGKRGGGSVAECNNSDGRAPRPIYLHNTRVPASTVQSKVALMRQRQQRTIQSRTCLCFLLLINAVSAKLPLVLVSCRSFIPARAVYPHRCLQLTG
jgi:hypothetical protein